MSFSTLLIQHASTLVKPKINTKNQEKINKIFKGNLCIFGVRTKIVFGTSFELVGPMTSIVG